MSVLVGRPGCEHHWGLPAVLLLDLVGARREPGAPFVEASEGLSVVNSLKEAVLITLAGEEQRQRPSVVPLFQKICFDIETSSGNRTLDYFQYMLRICEREVDA